VGWVDIRRHFPAKDRFISQASPCENFSGQSSVGTGFFSATDTVVKQHILEKDPDFYP
jgi:hypothetical protein